MTFMQLLPRDNNELSACRPEEIICTERVRTDIYLIEDNNKLYH